MLQLFQNRRFHFLYFFIFSFILINFITRASLLIVDVGSVDLNIFTLLKMFGVGLLYDTIAASYYFIPLTLYLLFVPTSVYNTKFHKRVLYTTAVIIFFALIFNSISEYFFWEEFGKRFNFIAVDYLVYTHEVIKNIQESYPLPQILTAILLTSLSLVYLFRAKLHIEEDRSSFKSRVPTAALLLLLPVLFFNLFDKQPLANVSHNIYNNELAKNGTYSLFSAFRHNELDYDEFYKTLDTKTVFQNLKKLEGFDANSSKAFTSNNPQKKMNVILVLVESLSAEYMGVYGSKKNLTPHLDALTKESLFFSNLYATGTRTVRGMEAVTLSIPPTPGRSIVKRPKNDNLDSIGEVLQAKGYENKFIYAGHGYFDNMNDFFSKNGFQVIDKLDFSDEEVTFSNAWGVCDEDLLNKTLHEADASFAKKQPFFSFVMTTSNHRPYTYPEGKIDIPSHTGRDGGVKYTDYALHSFLEKAKTKPWFNNTVFVILADHNGGSAGKKSLPLYRYKIPLIIYSPAFIKPQNLTKLASQIDAMPTLFHLLGFDYKAKFYGNNILATDFHERAFIGNYQKLGYVENGYLYYLTPDKKSHKMKIENLKLKSVEYKKETITEEEEAKIITYYQSASYIYKNSQ